MCSTGETPSKQAHHGDGILVCLHSTSERQSSAATAMDGQVLPAGKQTVRCSSESRHESALRLALAIAGMSSRRGGTRGQSGCISVPVTNLCPQRRCHPAPAQLRWRGRCCARLSHSMLPQPLAPPRIPRMVKNRESHRLFARPERQRSRGFAIAKNSNLGFASAFHHPGAIIRRELTEVRAWAWSPCPAIRGIRCWRHEKQTTQTCLENRN